MAVRSNKITREQFQKLVDEGLYLKKIAERLHVNENTVKHASYTYGIPIPKKVYGGEVTYPPKKITDIGKLGALVRAGWSSVKLCSEFSTSEEILISTMRKNKIWWAK